MTSNGIHELIQRTITGIFLLICFFGSYVHSEALYISLLGTILALILVFEWHKLVAHQGIFHRLISFAYPVMPITILIWFAHTYYSSDYYLPLYPVIIAWASDTGGYLVGKLIGFHKMCPTISPGKSWEGLIGSFAAVFITHIWLMPRIKHITQLGLENNIIVLNTLALVMTLVAFCGGFLLSYLKRKNNLKDAGNLLPGHGGLLDRFDSVFFVAYATAALLFLINFYH
ncbi:MAG: phosphatidate cytidylyltransferase [Candidatus Babeliales bacterium]|jgi:phosphatidate cytidylyltransferase